MLDSVQRVLLVAALLANVACQAPKVTKLPAFELASKTTPTSEVRAYFENEVDMAGFPAMVPMAYVTSQFSSGMSPKSCARSIVGVATKEVHPDIIVFYQGDSYYAGSSTSAFATSVGSSAVATGFSVPTYATPMHGLCFRLAPAKLGLTWDSTGMVIGASDEARKSGMFEGDRIVSINGSAVLLGEKHQQSPHYRTVLSLKPGQDVKLVWIRPGTGRMEGVAKMQENPPVHLEMTQADLTSPKLQVDD